jgi:dienelactone hydrolase
MKTLLLSLALGACAMSAQAKLVTQDLDYMDGDQALKGYLAYDDSVAKAPGILIAHQWMGLSSHEKGRAERLAKLGYVALAVDIYGPENKPADVAAAGKLAGRYKADRPLLRQRMLAGLSALKAQPRVDPSRIAALGFCFGGTAALELARSGADLKGVISFHGGLDSPDPSAGKAIKAKVLVLHGADDPYVPKKDIAAFEDELKAAGVDYQLVFYSQAVHAFTQKEAGDDNSKGAAYNANADRRSWKALTDFLDEIFKR